MPKRRPTIANNTVKVPKPATNSSLDSGMASAAVANEVHLKVISYVVTCLCFLQVADTPFTSQLAVEAVTECVLTSPVPLTTALAKKEKLTKDEAKTDATLKCYCWQQKQIIGWVVLLPPYNSPTQKLCEDIFWTMLFEVDPLGGTKYLCIPPPLHTHTQ